MAHTLTIGANAQQWYKKPVAMGGGGGAFDNSQGALQTFAAYFTTNLIRLQETSSSKPKPLGYTVTVDNADKITIIGSVKLGQGYTFTKVTTTVTPFDMATVIN